MSEDSILCQNEQNDLRRAHNLRTCKAKIGNFGRALRRYQDVGRLAITMNDRGFARVEILDPTGNVEGDIKDLDEGWRGYVTNVIEEVTIGTVLGDDGHRCLPSIFRYTDAELYEHDGYSITVREWPFNNDLRSEQRWGGRSRSEASVP